MGMKSRTGSLVFAAAVFLMIGCSHRGPVRMTDGDLEAYHVGNLPGDVCAAMGIQGPCIGSVAEIISGEQSAPITTTCPPHCSIEAVPLPQSGPTTITQDITSNGTRIIQKNSLTPLETNQSILVLPRMGRQGW